jgi:putative redox protein
MPDKDGGAEGFRPHELLEAALACCINMQVRTYAESYAVPLDSVTIRVRLDRGADGAVFHTEVELHGESLTREQRERLIEIAGACPVRQTLSKPIRFEP